VLVECSSGTYIRTLAADLGVALGGVAHIGDLRRLAVGGFDLADAHPLDEVEARGRECVLPISVAIRDLDEVTVDTDTASRVAHGATMSADIGGREHSTPTAFLDAAGDLLAVYEPWRPGVLKPSVVLAQPKSTSPGE
jgi:tRNA pseudouridine55 synthase